MHPKKTMDQTVVMSRPMNDPIRRGYRVYWGESEDKKDNIVSEVDYSDAFGYEETENMDYKNTVNTLKKMGVDICHQIQGFRGYSAKSTCLVTYISPHFFFYIRLGQ